MKNIQFSSRDTDLKVLIALVIGLMIVIRHLIGGYDLQFAVPNGMKL